MRVSYYRGSELLCVSNVSRCDAQAVLNRAHSAAIRLMVAKKSPHVLYGALDYDSATGEVKGYRIYYNAGLSDLEFDEVVAENPKSRLQVIHEGSLPGCKRLVERTESFCTHTVTLRQTALFLRAHHKYNSVVGRSQFAIGLYADKELIGVAVCMRGTGELPVCTCSYVYVYADGYEKDVALERLERACEQVAESMGYFSYCNITNGYKATFRAHSGLVVRPVDLKTANLFVEQFHRHNSRVTGCKFALGLYKDGVELVGVAICGRPVSRRLDNGTCLEINRLCTLGRHNACSKLYGASCRVAKAFGYEKVITYTLLSEPGGSLRAGGFTDDGIAGDTEWHGDRNRGHHRVMPHEMKTRWVKIL